MNKCKYILSFISSFFFTAVMACPLCTTETGQEVRAGIFNDNFFSNLLAVILPFAVFALISIVLYYGLPLKKLSGKKEEEKNDDYTE